MRILLSLFFLVFLLSFPAPSWGQGTESSPQITEEQLQRGDEIAEKAFQALEDGNFAKSENYWGELIELFPQNPAVWSNRGNVRLSQNKIQDAIADYNKAIAIAPRQPDPYLNRGIAYEVQEDWESAIADYDKVLELDPEDAMAYNNRGNAKAGKGNYEEAISDYEKAASLEPDFAIARSNAALNHYQVGNEKQALNETRKLVRKYPNFPDVRAALTAMLWAEGKEGEAESNWVAVKESDSRYRDIEWLEKVRRWPPQMVQALDNFLQLNN
jgi:tetratricopeptide (TPR) repeat protein